MSASHASPLHTHRRYVHITAVYTSPLRTRRRRAAWQEDLDVGMSESEMVRHRHFSDAGPPPEPRFPREVARRAKERTRVARKHARTRGGGID